MLPAGGTALAATFASALLLALAPAGAGAQATLPGCVPATNIEAIVDDSGSMAFRDFHELRRTSLELFTRLGGNEQKTLGAVEFGSGADTVFPPQPIASGRGAMISALRARINADNGGTNYDAGFIRGLQDNPAATARIFVTDSANDGFYRNAHRGGARTYVVGLRLGAPGFGDPAADRLLQIADETGGVYFPVADPALLQPTFNTISAAAACLPPPRTFTSRVIARAGQTSARSASVGATARKLDLVLSWAEPNNGFVLSHVQALGRRSRVIADLTGRGRPRKLRLRRASGPTFQSLVFSKPRGTRRIRFRVAATKVFRREPTTTQLTQRPR